VTDLRILEIADAIGTDQCEPSIPQLWDGRASERIADVLVERP